MDNSNQAPEAAPSASDVTSAAVIKVSGILYDRSAKHVVDSADIEFRKGNSRILALTGRDGDFEVQLPGTGEWKLGPDKKSYPGYYDFIEAKVTVNGPGDVGTITVDSDTATNARALEKAVKNILVSGEKLFEKGMKKYANSPNLSEDDVKLETRLVFEILSRALTPITGNVSEAKLETRLVELETLCHELEKETGTPMPKFTAGICCTTCRRRYYGNQALLQQCLCCPQSCDPC